MNVTKKKKWNKCYVIEFDMKMYNSSISCNNISNKTVFIRISSWITQKLSFIELSRKEYI